MDLLTLLGYEDPDALPISTFTWHNEILNGFASQAKKPIEDYLDIKMEEWGFDFENSDFLYRVASVCVKARLVFKNDDAVRDWLTNEDTHLKEVPLVLLASYSGTHDVLHELAKIQILKKDEIELIKEEEAPDADYFETLE